MGWWILLPITVSLAYIAVVALLLPRFFLQNKYKIKQVQDRGIKKYRHGDNARGIVYEPDLSLRKYIKQYVLADNGAEKSLKCMISPDIEYMEYDVALFNNKRKGFIIGTDDYMTKPVDEEEMVLRVGALLRRSKIVSEKKLTVGSTTLYYDSFTVVCGDTTNEHPQKEFLLLFKLLSYPGKIFTRRQLMDEIWDMESESDERTVDVHVSRLRDRYRSCPDFEIVTVRGLGYKAVHLK